MPRRTRNEHDSRARIRLADSMRRCRLDCLRFWRPYSRRFIAKAKAKYQHCFYLAIFALCLTAPVFNTLMANPSECGRKESSAAVDTRGRNTLTISCGCGTGTPTRIESIILVPGAKTAFLVIW